MRRRRVLFLAIGSPATASTRHRVLALRPHLEAAGLEVEVRFPCGEGRAPRAGWRLLDLLADRFGPRRADVVVVHRKTYPPPFAHRLRRAGQPLVFDLDDALDLPPPGAAPSPRYARNFHATLAAADLVLCGSGELRRRAGHPRSVLLPTAIDSDRFRPGAVAAAAGPTLGWIGAGENLRYLERLAPVFVELARRHPGLRLVVGADRPPALPGVEVEFRRWNLADELSIFGGIAVGLMPLDDTEWARAKCAFKALQCMALGIPVVASPVGENRVVVEHGVSGLLPEGPEAWLAALDGLLRDPARRAALGAAGRAVVEERYALSRIAPRFVEALEPLLARPAGGAASTPGASAAL